MPSAVIHRMIDHARGVFRRSMFRTYRFLKHPRKLKSNAAMRWFARHFLDKRVWRPTQHTLAGGAAVGLFICMQFLPVQMPFAVIVAAIFRVNIPIALAMCWLTNPLTMPPLIPLEYAVGKWVLSWFSAVPATPFPTELPESLAGTWLALKEHTPVMFFGGVIIGGLLAPAGYIITWMSWDKLHHLRQRKTARRAAGE
ncbi:MAG TPA: DUF2062 domain-containing protein [Prosthecobacter sp.]|nr:DUF2062 domain-containing protein [Prosthecobacter sp.]